MIHLQGRDVLDTHSWTTQEIGHVLDLAGKLKKSGRAAYALDILKGKSLLLLFFGSSTRTRLSFTSAMQQLGGFVQAPVANGLQLGLDDKPGCGEALKDTARISDLMVDCVGIRLNGPISQNGGPPRAGFGTAVMSKYAEFSQKPVVNLACDMQHPTQAMADLMTFRETSGSLNGKKLVIHWAYSPMTKHYSSVHADALIAAAHGMDVTIAHPEPFPIEPRTETLIRNMCARNGRRYTRSQDLRDAVEGADFVFPRAWVTPQFYCHKPDEEARIAGQFRDWRLTENLMRRTNNGYFAHVMPFDRGNEVDDAVADGPRSLAFKQAENLLHVRKALLASLLASPEEVDALGRSLTAHHR